MLVETSTYDVSRLGCVIDTEEMRRVQIEILDALDAFCEEHHLTYYLSGGTLLGAVRHKGYIPWDDDIDINMPRPDYDRLMELTNGRLNDHLIIAEPFGKFDQSTPFPRICDTRYVLKSSSKEGENFYYTYLFADVFPIEGLPTEMRKVKRHYLLAKSMVVMRKLAFFQEAAGPMDWHKMIRLAARPFAKLIGYKFWNRCLLKLAKKYKYDECEYVGVVTSCFHTLQEYIRRDGYGTPVKVEFEGKMYNAPADTHKYLSNLYGDYMKLPPEEKRQSHHSFVVYENKEAIG